MSKPALDDAHVDLLVPMLLTAPIAPLANFFNPLILQKRQRQNSWRELGKGLVG
jgi:NAD kinase